MWFIGYPRLSLERVIDRCQRVVEQCLKQLFSDVQKVDGRFRPNLVHKLRRLTFSRVRQQTRDASLF